MNIKTFTIEDIRSWNPRYDPTKHLQIEYLIRMASENPDHFVQD